MKTRVDISLDEFWRYEMSYWLLNDCRPCDPELELRMVEVFVKGWSKSLPESWLREQVMRKESKESLLTRWWVRALLSWSVLSILWETRLTRRQILILSHPWLLDFLSSLHVSSSHSKVAHYVIHTMEVSQATCSLSFFSTFSYFILPSARRALHFHFFFLSSDLTTIIMKRRKINAWHAEYKETLTWKGIERGKE